MFENEKMKTAMERASSLVGLDLVYLFSNGFWVMLRYGMLAAFGLLFTVGFARFGSKELFGQYQFILSIIALFSVLSLPGFNIVALRSIATGGDVSIIRLVVRWSFFSSLLALPIIAGYVMYRRSFLGDISIEMTYALFAGALLFPFFYAPNTWYTAYEGKTRFMPVTIRTLISTGIATGALLASLFLHANVIVLVIIYFGVNALFSWYFYFEALDRNKSENKTNSNSLDIRYGFSVTLQKFSYGLSENIPPILISSFFGFNFLAVFQIAFFFVNTISGFLSALSTIYLPKLFGEEKLAHKKIILQNIVAGIFSSLFLAFLLQTVFLFFYGSGYSDSRMLAWMLLPLIVVSPIRIYLINFFTAKGSNTFIVLSFVLANLLSAILFFSVRNSGPTFATSVYMYSLSLFTLFLFLSKYLFVILKKEIRPTESFPVL